MKHLQSNKHFVSYLAHCKPEQRRKLLLNSNASEIDSLCEIISNILKGNFDVPDNKKKQLVYHKNFLRSVSNPKINISTAKRKILQYGNGVDLISKIIKLLLPELLKYLASLEHA